MSVYGGVWEVYKLMGNKRVGKLDERERQGRAESKVCS